MDNNHNHPPEDYQDNSGNKPPNHQQPPDYGPTYQNQWSGQDPDVSQNKHYAVLCYLRLLWFVPFITRKNSPFVKYHLNQGLLLFIGSFAVNILQRIIRIITQYTLEIVQNAEYISDNKTFAIFSTIHFLLHFSLTIALCIFVIIGITNAASGKKAPLPLIGHFQLIK